MTQVILFMLGGFLLLYALASLLPGWRSLAAAAVVCAIFFYYAFGPSNVTLGHAMMAGLVMPAWIGAVGGIATRATTLPGMIWQDRRLLVTLAGAPASGVIGYFVI